MRKNNQHNRDVKKIVSVYDSSRDLSEWKKIIE